MKEQLTIKEFSELSGVDSSTLRYWDEIGLFSPAHRSAENNYRYYSPFQIIAVNFTVVLSSLGVPLKTIKEMSDSRNPEMIAKLIEHQEKILDRQMLKLRESHSLVHTRLELINYGMKVEQWLKAADDTKPNGASKDTVMDKNQVAVLHLDETVYITGPRNTFKAGSEFYEPFVDFCKKADELRINLNFPIGAYHDSVESFNEAPGEPDHFISMDPTGNRKREEGDYLVGFRRGYYGKFGDLSDKMMQYVKDNNLKLTGPVYTLYLHDETCVNDPDQYLSQVCIAIEK